MNSGTLQEQPVLLTAVFLAQMCLALTHSVRIQSVMGEKAWPPECEAASLLASPIRNQRELSAASWLTSSFLFGSGAQLMERYFPHSGQVFPVLQRRVFH